MKGRMFALFQEAVVRPFVKYLRILLLLSLAGLSLMTEVAQASDEDAFLGQVRPASEQAMGQGHSAIWTLPLAATQYQPSQPTAAMQAALQAQQEGRFLDALILLDEADKNWQANADTGAELKLLHASFLLQGNQPRQALEMLAPLLGKNQHAADAYALTAMAYLQQGQMQAALDAADHANHAQGSAGDILPPLALSYALQGAGRLAQARAVMHGFNTGTSPSAITLAREAELALTLDQTQAAKALIDQAHAADAAHPYVIAVSGLVNLIDGQAQEAKAAFATALQRDPKDAKALLGLGLAEIKLGNFQAGQEKLLAANEADPGNALILTYLGRSQQNLGQTEAARASWHRAEQADPKDPIPWLYQAQAALQANRPLDARDSLREAQARLGYRSVYRGERLLQEDEQLLQANLAETQRQLGLDSLAFQTLSTSVGESNSSNLRNQADLLQGQRFGESARRSLLLQSLFNEKPGTMPAALDIYGDGAGQTGAANPQHGVVSGLGSQQASYNNYDELFTRRTTLEADATTGSQNTNGEQVRAGVGSDTLGIGIAQMQFKTDGFAPFQNLDNRAAQAIVQWQPTNSTQVFVSQQTFNSHWGALFYPAQTWAFYDAIMDDSQVTRVGLRHTLTDGSELRVLSSTQQTNQTQDIYSFANPPVYQYSQPGASDAHSEELQYRRSGADYATQWGMQQSSGRTIYSGGTNDNTRNAQQVYAAWQQTLNPYWQLEAGLGLGKIDNQDNVTAGNSTYLKRWLPKLGVAYTPDTGTHLRIAAWEGMSVPGVGDATLAPVSLAGILTARPNDNSASGSLIHGVALGGDKQLSSAWLLDAETQQRKTDEPIVNNPLPQTLSRQEVDESRLALHWQPQGKPWTVSLAYDDERIQNDPNGIFSLDSVDGQSLHSQQLALRWFASAQWTVNATWSHNQVVGTQQLQTAPLISSPYQDNFNQLDADLSWQFNRVGSLTAGVRNAANTSFQYTEIDPLNPRFSIGRLTYAKLKLAW
jgi:predicted Zn-dependent protease